ncbi:MAG: hypothetical protein LBR60_04050 [Fibrobacter sp.]|jgi:hypothetical protein|nr:hypothetical protein [Fibrobacter sp.]
MSDFKLYIKWYIIGFFIIFVPIAMYGYNSKQNLKENGVYTNAVIYKLEKCGKKSRNRCIRYNYIVDGVKYENWGKWYPKSDTLSVGDSIEIIYNKENPNDCMTKRDTELKWWQ